MDYKFSLSTDSTSDLNYAYVKENGIYFVSLTYSIEKDSNITSHLDNFKEPQEYLDFFRALRRGAFSRTSILNYKSHYEHFLDMAKNGCKDTVHFTISSGLSPTVDIAERAAADIKELYPEFRVYAIDSLSATIGQGILVKIARKMQKQGKTAQETAEYCNQIKHKMQHFLIASDLYYLKRGGRISGANAVIGSMLSIKPILSFDNQGKLSVIEKCRGYKKAFAFIENNIKLMPPAPEPYMTVVHTDCEEKAKALAAQIEAMGYPCEIMCMGPVIGSHVGPDSVSLGYISVSDRNQK